MTTNNQARGSKMKRYKRFLVFLTILTLVHGKRNSCTDDEIPCDEGGCIARFFGTKGTWCDGFNDCRDESDEKYCISGSDNNCTDKHFECYDGRCIPLSLRCDRTPDCVDRSDEQECETIDRRQFSQTATSGPERDIFTPPIATDFYDGRREDDSYSSPHPPPYNPSINGDQNNRHPDTFPGSSFPSHHQPTLTPFASEPTTPRWGYRTTSSPRYTPSRRDYPYVPREKPFIFPPRFISYVPHRSVSSGYPRHNVKTPNYPRFYFAHNYTTDAEYQYRTNIRNAKAWLLSQRYSYYDWGKDTPRALIALSLISNSFETDVEENELMRKRLQTHLGVKIIRNDTGLESMSTTRLAMYINALLATCQDPRDFMGLDLGGILHYRQYYLKQDQSFVNPIIFLSLCLVDIPVNVDYINRFLLNSFPAEISKDLHILATLAMACVAQQNPNNRTIQYKLDEAARNLLKEMNPYDGSFGSKYSTALAAQALMSVNTSLRWDHRRTLDYLAGQQQIDGSFGDMQSTYYTLLALSGRSLLHVRNTLCDFPVDQKKVTKCSPDEIMNRQGPRKVVLYTLRVDNPETFSAGLLLSVPDDASAYDIMCVAADQDRRFSFSHKITNELLGVHTIANLPSDPERGKFWNLYWLPREANSVNLTSRYTGDIRRLVPKDGDELLYWYLNDIDI